MAKIAFGKICWRFENSKPKMEEEKKRHCRKKKKKKAGKPKTEILHGKSVFYCKQNEQKRRFFWFQQYFELVVHDYAYV